MKKLLFAAVVFILAVVPVKAKAAVTAADFSVSNTSDYSELIGGKSARINVSGGSSGATHKVVWFKDNWADWGVLVAATTSKSINVTLPNKNGLISLVLDTTVGGETKSVTKTYRVHHNGKSLLTNPRTNEIVPDWVWGGDAGFRDGVTKYYRQKFNKALNQVTWNDVYNTYGLSSGDSATELGIPITCNSIGDVIYYMPNLEGIVLRGSWRMPTNFAIFSKVRLLWLKDNGRVVNENVPINALPITLQSLNLGGANVGGVAADLSRYTNLDYFNSGWQPGWENKTNSFTSVNITGLKKLTTFRLAYNLSHQNKVIGLSGCTTLTTIGLTGIPVTDLSFINWHSRWQEIQLQNTGITALPANISNQTQLNMLAVHSNKMNTMPSLARLPRTARLEIGGNQMTVRPAMPAGVTLDEGNNLYAQSTNKVKLKTSALNLSRGVEYKTESTVISQFGVYTKSNNTLFESLRTGHIYKLVPYTGYTQYFEDTNGDGSYTIKRNIYVPRTVQARLFVDSAVYSDVFNINVVNEQISMVVPTTITAAINPNKNVLDYNGNSATDSTDTFSSPAFTFQNKAVQPMKISITGISPVSSPGLVAANTYSDSGWANLSSQLSGSRIALGFRMKNAGSWLLATTADAWYAPGQQYTFGVLSGSASAAVELKAKYGLSHSAKKTLTYNVTYKVEQY